MQIEEPLLLVVRLAMLASFSQLPARVEARTSGMLLPLLAFASPPHYPGIRVGASHVTGLAVITGYGDNLPDSGILTRPYRRGLSIAWTKTAWRVKNWVGLTAMTPCEPAIPQD